MPEHPFNSVRNGNAGGSGRDASGRFVPGNQAARGRGSGLAGRIALLRKALLAAVTPNDIRAIARALVRTAKSGDTHSAKILLLHVLGKPVELDLVERLEALEALAGELLGSREDIR